MGALSHEGLSSRVIGGFYEVYNDIGPGLPEAVYQRALCVAMAARGVQCSREVRYEVRFRGVDVGSFRADLVVEGTLVVEIKCAERISKEHIRQVLYYLKASGLRLALILNVGETPSFKRLVR